MSGTLLPWQTPLAQHLEHVLDSARLPHAVLIRGNPGWGEQAFAQWLAARLLSLDAERDLASVAHPDLRLVEPDGAFIKVDQIRELNEFTVGRPQLAGVKVAVIASAERMNANAQNALLKSLEEPPAGTHLLLTTDRAGRLLPTIRSRCQQHVVPMDADLARSWYLHQGGDADLLEDYGGAPLAALAAGEAGEVPIGTLLERSRVDAS